MINFLSQRKCGHAHLPIFGMIDAKDLNTHFRVTFFIFAVSVEEFGENIVIVSSAMCSHIYQKHKLFQRNSRC